MSAKDTLQKGPPNENAEKKKVSASNVELRDILPPTVTNLLSPEHQFELRLPGDSLVATRLVLPDLPAGLARHIDQVRLVDPDPRNAQGRSRHPTTPRLVLLIIRPNPQRNPQKAGLASKSPAETSRAPNLSQPVRSQTFEFVGHVHHN